MTNFYKKLAVALILMLAIKTIKPCELAVYGQGESTKDVQALLTKLQTIYKDLPEDEKKTSVDWLNLCATLKKYPLNIRDIRNNAINIIANNLKKYEGKDIGEKELFILAAKYAENDEDYVLAAKMLTIPMTDKFIWSEENSGEEKPGDIYIIGEAYTLLQSLNENESLRQKIIVLIEKYANAYANFYAEEAKKNPKRANLIKRTLGFVKRAQSEYPALTK